MREERPNGKENKYLQLTRSAVGGSSRCAAPHTRLGRVTRRGSYRAAPVHGLGAEAQAALDLDHFDVEAVAGLDVGALLTFKEAYSMVLSAVP